MQSAVKPLPNGGHTVEISALVQGLTEMLMHQPSPCCCQFTFQTELMLIALDLSEVPTYWATA